MITQLHKLSIVVSFALVVVSFISRSQNLVPNPSFENYGILPCSWILTSFEFSQAMDDWTMPTQGSTDVFSMLVPMSCYAHCFSTDVYAVGHQAPHNGDVMSAILTYGDGCGFQPDYREYLQVELTSPLVVGQSYEVEMFVSLGDFCSEASNNIGVKFSTNAIGSGLCTEIQEIPEINFTDLILDTTNWVQLVDTFVATSASTYMTIGNFYDNQDTQHQSLPGPNINARYFIDDISVSEVLPGGPASGFSVSDPEICEKFCIDFFDQSTNNPISWLWEFDGGAPASSTDQNPTDICYTVPGIYDVTLITTNSFGSDTLTIPDYVTVFQTPPFPTITVNGNTLTSSPAAAYQWQFNSVDIPGATNQSYIMTQPGYYTVVIADSNGCKNSATILVDFTGVEDIINSDDIVIYPNPSTGKFIVHGINKFHDIICLRVLNSLNQVVFRTSDEIQDASEMEIDLNSFANGIYYLEIQMDNGSVRKKVSISR